MGISVAGTPDNPEISNLFQVEVDKLLSEEPDSTWFDEPTETLDVAVMPDEAHLIKSVRKFGFNETPTIHEKYVEKWGLESGKVNFQCIIDLIEFQEAQQLQIDQIRIDAEMYRRDMGQRQQNQNQQPQ